MAHLFSAVSGGVAMMDEGFTAGMDAGTVLRCPLCEFLNSSGLQADGANNAHHDSKPPREVTHALADACPR